MASDLLLQTKEKTKIAQSVSRPRAGSKRLKKATPTPSTPVPHPPNMTDIVEEVIVAKGVVKYYITAEGVDEKREGVFLTQNEGMLCQYSWVQFR